MANNITPLYVAKLSDYDIDGIWFQQDSAKCHTAQAKIALLLRSFLEIIWTARSCDLTQLDFFLWAYLRSNVYIIKPTAIQQLRDKLKKLRNNLL